MSKGIIGGLTITAGTVADSTWTIAKTSGLQTALDAKQATLVSGTNIKTINGSSVLGSGDLTVSGAGDFLADGTVPMTGDLEFAQNQALQFVFENRTSDPGSPVVGQCWFRTDL